ncbi:unnamed protein product [Clonostachys solani]|uniref:Membrane protein PTM1 n=1 Tax=Clonostachys solani TaxID=160281 RepID=A0A9N9W8S7_9HYPO|nr:unnamed protein product [Clonostachys solani]
MKLLWSLMVLVLSFWTAQALELALNEKPEDNHWCAGMYDRKTWGGPIDPFIHVKFLDQPKKDGKDPVASFLIFEWRDKSLVEIDGPNGFKVLAVCNQDFVNQGRCNSSSIDQYIVAPDADEKSKSKIVTQAVHLDHATPFKYAIKKTGYYCVFTHSDNSHPYTAIAEFRNAYGELAATQIPKLPFYGGVTILYLLVAGYWGVLYYQHRHDILAVQNYITAILAFLPIEMVMTWGFYDFKNRNGSNIGSKVMLIIVAILNSARNSFSFFLLLIVCMGYGVVKPSLGRTMIWVRWLAAAHFIFGLMYSITSLIVSPESATPFVLLIVLPLAGTLTAFYVWTLNSLNATLKELRERKQNVKESMYKKLWWAILASIIVIFGFLFFNSFAFASIRDPNFVPKHWKSRWFVLDGWLNIVYFADVVWIAYIWRPTANNRRFAMSDEVAQDDDGNFEFADIGVPDDFDEDDEEANVGKNRGQNQGQSSTGAAFAGAGIAGAAAAGAAAAAASSSSHRPLPRESLDGETIFAVGEDGDKMSDLDDDDDDDDDDSDDEEAKLVRKND